MTSTVTSMSISILRVELLPRATGHGAVDMALAINGQWTSGQLAGPSPRWHFHLDDLATTDLPTSMPSFPSYPR